MLFCFVLTCWKNVTDLQKRKAAVESPSWQMSRDLITVNSKKNFLSKYFSIYKVQFWVKINSLYWNNTRPRYPIPFKTKQDFQASHVKIGKKLFGFTCATEERESGWVLSVPFRCKAESQVRGFLFPPLELASHAMLHKSHSFLKAFSRF